MLRIPEATYDLAWVFLLTGRWSEGWRAFEARWHLPTFASRRPDVGAPEWGGQSLGDGVLLLYAEQGFGDTVQMIRYARQVRRRCGQLIILCPQPLQRLIAAHPDVDRVIVSSVDSPLIAAQAALMSLPRIFATTPETIPDAVGYLTPPPPIHHRLADNRRRRIGIVWAGSPANKIDRARTCDASFFVRALTPDGLTQLSGDFQLNYLQQNGAKFGNFAGVSIGTDGIVTALFDNGVTRPVFMIPVATFTNPNGLQSLSGNTWISTDFSGNPTLREAGDAGAGQINSAALESSTVDLGEEFTRMITTQRAYSSAAKVITTSDQMLDELLSIKR